MFFIRFH